MISKPETAKQIPLWVFWDGVLSRSDFLSPPYTPSRLCVGRITVELISYQTFNRKKQNTFSIRFIGHEQMPFVVQQGSETEIFIKMNGVFYSAH